jgi:altronate dehydratase small subunit
MARALVLHEADNVGTLMHPVSPGDVAEVSGRATGSIDVKQEIPFGHKIALRPIDAGANVIKYGQVIGTAGAAIAPGYHVHVHNVVSGRGRGDLAAKKDA